MRETFEDECDDRPCPICLSAVSDEFIAMVEQAAAEPRQVMTLDEAQAWLRSF